MAKNLIDFDKEWSAMMAKKPEEFADPEELENFYVQTAEFPAGFMTEYAPSMITGTAVHQDLATGFPLGKRFKSSLASRVCDANPIHLGHHATADGRWRIYVFADPALPGTGSPTDALAQWLSTAPDSPLAAMPAGHDADAWFDVKVIYQHKHEDLDINAVPEAFKPLVGPFKLTDYEKVYGTIPGNDIFDVRGIDRAGAVVVVRPDQYVANILPLADTRELGSFFAQIHAGQHV